MPIYEFYCKDCHTIFSFFSKTINTNKIPKCPRCQVADLTRQMSVFSFTGKAKEENDSPDLPFDDIKMEKAMNLLAKEADKIDENDPKQAVNLMKKLSDVTGIKLGPNMEEALKRMENGEDIKKIESEMGDILENEEPFLIPEKKKELAKYRRFMPERDETLYDL